MLVLLSLLFLGSVCSLVHNRNLSDVCDNFHAPVSVFNAKYGKLMMYLGMTREEFKAGNLTLTINNCGGEDGGVCVVKSAWKNAILEGNQDNKYKIVLTEVGERDINKPRSSVRCRGTTFPVQNYVRLSLMIDSDIVDGIPKIPQVSLVSFGGLHECTPKPIRPICPWCTKCPSELATVQGNGVLLTFPAERKRIIEFTVAFEDNATINAIVTSEKARLQHKRRCGSLHSFRLRRHWRNARNGNKVSVFMSIAESPIPMVTAFTSQPHRSSTCGLSCGVFKGCVKPTPTPQLITTSTRPSLPSTTAASSYAPSTVHTPTTTPIFSITEKPKKPLEKETPEEPANPQELNKLNESEISKELEKPGGTMEESEKWKGSIKGSRNKTKGSKMGPGRTGTGPRPKGFGRRTGSRPMPKGFGRKTGTGPIIYNGYI